MSAALLSITDLSVEFDTPHGAVRAVDRVSLSLADGERVALLGESGCGKSVLALTVLGLLPRNARVAGSLRLEGVELAGAPVSARGSRVALCWSNAERFFDPVRRVGEQIVEAYTIQHPGGRRAGQQQALARLESLGFEDPRRVYRSYPCQLSGGMNQRAMIAMSLINRPRMLIVDEPTRGLDDASRERVIAALAALDGVTLLLITHDVDCALRLSGSALIMRGGRLIDRLSTAPGAPAPALPYTELLLRSCPHRWARPGSLPDPLPHSEPAGRRRP